MRINYAAIELNQAEVSPMNNGSFELTPDATQRALSEMSQIAGVTAFLRNEDEISFRKGSLFYDIDANPDLIILTLEPLPINTASS